MELAADAEDWSLGMSGHGHVVPNADGSRAQCGSPGICTVCSFEATLHRPKCACGGELIAKYNECAACHWSQKWGELVTALGIIGRDMAKDGHQKALEAIRKLKTAAAPETLPYLSFESVVSARRKAEAGEELTFDMLFVDVLLAIGSGRIVHDQGSSCSAGDCSCVENVALAAIGET